MRQWEQLRETWDADASEPISDFSGVGDRVAVRFIWRGAGYGPESNIELTSITTVRKGRMVFVEFFWDHARVTHRIGVVLPARRARRAGAPFVTPIGSPMIEGPRLVGLPADDHGFIPIDEHARVPGVEDVYAAGDGTTFPIKQGGLGTQQADAAAEHIAARLGAAVEAKPFHPVLRGQLITGAESLQLRHDFTGGHGEGTASADYLWWPPHKVSGRYLAERDAPA